MHWFTSQGNKFDDPYPGKTDLSRLLSTGGGVVLSREPDPEMVEGETAKLPYHADKVGTMKLL